ncbi:hypothetical protein H632_c490p2 [Helicosporidium sp. ATCC 50920]|nr:hypothetical protein H632_c490p2 [Helicosporidium sp. ATCC 50920]|eukprot:KDD75810.1 hypothetical protein H632_c490p2 [Helicosporidium sp. ATCC 50920]
MSLQREHATALAYFHRALQLEPSYAYAYTLSGHEYAANDDLDKALTCYRNALRADSQHYNAWFGVGHVYYRQEQYPLAEYHFRRALSINKNSSVLRCYLGMALHKIGRLPDALATLTAATAADPRNPLARFERAAVLVAQERLPDALEELEALKVKNVAPREASVLFQMGKVLKKMGRTDEALACLCAALDLQPPSADSNLIRAAVERLKVADEQDGEEL